MADNPALRGTPLTTQQLKALGHPLRVQLLELLHERGPATATMLGERVGESSGTTSYHLRQLAQAQMIADDEERSTGRDRYWKAVGGWSLERDLMDDEATRATADVVIDELTRLRLERSTRWHRDRDRWPEVWQDVAMESVSRLNLTPAQTREMADRLMAVVEEYRAQQGDLGDPDVARLTVVMDLLPSGDPPPSAT